jgi:Gram-negative bacterial TonB protein C-terminal
VQFASIYEKSRQIGMQRISVVAVIEAVMLVACANQSFAQALFKPPEVTLASDIPYPIQSIADGVVVLDASLNDKGALTGITAVRDVPSLTSPAISAIRPWKFSPATRLGKPEPSTMRVVVAFRPRSYFAADPSFTPVDSPGDPNRVDQGYVPPGIVSVAYPQYPINAAAPGTVVIQVTVGKSSAINHLKVVRDLPPFTQFALSGANKWRFQAATLDGKPVASNLAVAFVFAPLPATN